MYCTNCGIENTSNSKFCIKCGNKLQNIAQLQTNTSVQTIQNNTDESILDRRNNLSRIVMMFWIAFAIDVIQSLATLNTGLDLDIGQKSLAIGGLVVMFGTDVFLILKIAERRKWAAYLKVSLYSIGIFIELSSIATVQPLNQVIELISSCVGGYALYLLFFDKSTLTDFH